MKTIVTFIITLLLCGQAFAGADQIHAKSLQTSIVQQIVGYKKVSVRMEVTNYAEPVKVFVKYRALDFGGYELASGLATDTFQKHDSKYLTTTLYVENEAYARIHKWEIGEISAYPAK